MSNTYLINKYIFNKEAGKVGSAYKLENWQLPYIKAVANDLKINSNDSFLDIGAGTGHVAIEICKRANLSVGIDISIESLKKAKIFSDKILSNEKRCFFVVATVEKLPFKDCVFTKVSSIACLEHIENYYDSLREIKRILKNDGLLFICVPNSKNKMPFIFKIWSFYHDKNIGHIQSFDPIWIEEELKKLKFELIDKRYHGHLIKIIQILLHRLFLPLRNKDSRIWWYLENIDSGMRYDSSSYLISYIFIK